MNTSKRMELKNNIRLIKCIAILILMILGIVLPYRQAEAYTDEEKAQAKAWLSAHGYSPDAGGASAAYQDYLNGKFDEELGITREASTEAETQSAYDDGEDKKEKATKESGSTSNSSVDNTQTSAGAETVWDIMGGTSEENTSEEQISTEQITEEVTTEAEPSTQIAYDDSDDEDDANEDEEDEKKSSIKMFMSEYKEIIIGVILSILVIVIVIGAVILAKK